LLRKALEALLHRPKPALFRSACKVSSTKLAKRVITGGQLKDTVDSLIALSP
jgi:hypothetical protein